MTRLPFPRIKRSGLEERPSVRASKNFHRHCPVPLYFNSAHERKAMDKYSEALLRSSIIHPSSSPDGAVFFFVGQKDGSLQPCIDYSSLNDITIKNHDILIFYPDLATHQRHVRQVLIRLLENKLYVKAEKCDFDASSVSFLGYVISANHIMMDPEKSVFEWTPKAEEAFTIAPILTVPDPVLQFMVEVDASNKGVGAVLYQRSATENCIHPCAYLSRKLTPAERNYDMGNRELLVIKIALEEWRHCLEGAEQSFIVWTNHKNLEYLKSAKTLNSRQARHFSLAGSGSRFPTGRGHAEHQA
ncbi:hypothetical protein L3Q82_010864 [Scortum barcoo]|uniref:Uncharacterized protein n=1 Tax=Scortum barcoo TaxID=214431 RepID=A0ACB8W8Q3_9TELE|nr:hypothetical protein L3Q82_010864 [Scortum barcoo]